MYCPSFFNGQPKQAETLARKGQAGKNANHLADYTFCCFEKQSKHCFSCRQLAVERQHQRRRKCPLIGHTNNRPSLLSIIEDLAKFGHSYSSVADRRPQSSAMHSPVGAYGFVLRCRPSAPTVVCYAVADRRLRSRAVLRCRPSASTVSCGATLSPIGVYGLVLRCRPSASTVSCYAVADRRLRSRATLSPIGVYGFVLRCRRLAPTSRATLWPIGA